MTLYLIEHKTTSEDISPGSTYWRRLTLDAQVSTYYAGAKALGHDVSGCLYDVLRKPMHRPLRVDKPNPETPEEYALRVLGEIRKDFDRYYQRQTIVRLESEQHEAARDAWQTAGAIRDGRRLQIWPRNPDACMQWSRPCDYFDVCTGVVSIDDPIRFRTEERPHGELADGSLSLVTQSALRSHRSCQRKYQLRYELRRRPVGAEDPKLTRGKSIHAALEAWWKSGGDIAWAMSCLDRGDDLFGFALESAMLAGYHEYWGPPTSKVISVEQEFRIPLINPETGAASRTFELAGKIDALVEVT